jgi:hypothetical protein
LQIQMLTILDHIIYCLYIDSASMLLYFLAFTKTDSLGAYFIVFFNYHLVSLCCLINFFVLCYVCQEHNFIIFLA